MNLGTQIKLRRKQLGMTQYDVAAAMDTPQPVISKWESSGYRGYTLSTLEALAVVLECTLEVRFVPNP